MPPYLRRLFWRSLIAFFCLFTITATAQIAEGITAGTPPELAGRLIVGYQGWFGCPGDYAGNTQWTHWFFNNTPDAAHIGVDLLPSLRQFGPNSLCQTGLKRPDGTSIPLFSSQNPQIVAAHFKWMAHFGIDGASVERFVAPLSIARLKDRSDHVLANVRAAAEAQGRVFFVSYDVSGADPATVINSIRSDWCHLVEDLKLTSSPAYLHVNGKPVLQIWGFGFTDRPGNPPGVSALIADLKDGQGRLKAATLIGGVPTNWRTLTKDSKTDPAWAQVYRSYDVISPWSVGRFADAAGADRFLSDYVIPDSQETASLGIGYMPVIFPGFSWYNLQTGRGKTQSAILNQIPRRCGNFLWRQVYNLLSVHVDMVYAAMFDEVDEGTALFKMEPQMANLPAGSKMVYLNEEGCTLPDDWYLRVTGRAAAYFRNNRVPPANLGNVLSYAGPSAFANQTE